MSNTIQNTVKEIALKHTKLKIKKEDIAEDSNLTELLLLDSLRFLQFVIEVENEFDVELMDENMNVSSLTIFDNLCKMILEKKG